jgi:hypothetical protein
MVWRVPRSTGGGVESKEEEKSTVSIEDVSIERLARNRINTIWQVHVPPPSLSDLILWTLSGVQT